MFSMQWAAVSTYRSLMSAPPQWNFSSPSESGQQGSCVTWWRMFWACFSRPLLFRRCWIRAVHGYSSSWARSPPMIRSVYCTPHSSGSSRSCDSYDNLLPNGVLAGGRVGTGSGAAVVAGWTFSGSAQHTSTFRSCAPHRLASRKRTTFDVSSGWLSSRCISGHWATVTQSPFFKSGVRHGFGTAQRIEQRKHRFIVTRTLPLHTPVSCCMGTFHLTGEQ